MDEVVILQNEMSQDGWRRLHVMSGEPVDPVQALQHWVQVDPLYRLSVKASQDEIRLHHLEATWLAREAMYYTFRREGTGKKHPVVVYVSATRVAEMAAPQGGANANGGSKPPLRRRLDPWKQIYKDSIEAALLFKGTFGFWPSAAWVRIWPKGLAVEEAYIPIAEDYGMDLFAVKWVPEGFVVVGGGLSAPEINAACAKGAEHG